MKQVLKPLGHCLTTAVMTSAMLRVYALPTVEAAVPNPTSPPAGETSPAQDSSLDRLPEAVPPAQGVSTPEVVTPIETTSTNPLPDKAESNQVSGSMPSEVPASKPEEPVSDGLTPSGSKKSPAVTQKEPASPPPTVAGMRQTVEKRLAAIVERDKISRDEQWRQNLMVSTLQAAWNGEFEQARKIATHPALSAVWQAELLAKIAAVEAQLQPSVAQQPDDKKLSSRPSQQQRANSPLGRQIPSASFSSVFPSIASYPGLGHQCPAIGTPPVPNQSAPSSPAPAQTDAKNTSKAGIPAFVPNLSENLAAQLIQLSQTPSVAPPKKLADLKRVFAAPQSFVGVAAKSVDAKSIPQPTLAKSSPPPAETTPSRHAASSTLIEPEAKTAPSLAADADAITPDAAAPHSTPVPGLSHSSTPKTDRLLASIDRLPLDQLISQPAAPPAQQAVDSPKHHLKEFAVSLVQFIPIPIQQVWDWWNPAVTTWIEPDLDIDQPVGLQSLPSLEPSTTFADSPTTNSVISAQTGLNPSLLDSWRLALPSVTPVAPIRSAYKFSSLHFLSAKATTAKLAQPIVLDANALIAASCARSQLTNQFSNTVIDPATSKRQGWVNLMFPLPIPAVVTSVFGWRTHPISGNLSFHTGLDLGAPMGTPVLAALEGQVVAADAMGGYGLAVVVENSKTRQRNLYGHLSGIAVQPGTQVTQGTILGWVGSTGNSTGPHLHFESMVQTDNGWTAIDPLATAALASARTE